MLGIIAAVLITAGGDFAWYKINYNGQSLEVWGQKLDDGKIRWLPKEQPPRPVRKPDAAPYKINGVVPGKLVDGRKVRASDPETLAQAVKDAEAAKPKCPGPKCPEPKPDAPQLPFLKPKPLLPFGLTLADVVFGVSGAFCGYMAFKATERFFPPPNRERSS